MVASGHDHHIMQLREISVILGKADPLILDCMSQMDGIILSIGPDVGGHLDVMSGFPEQSRE